jgi:hypothetical protein
VQEIDTHQCTEDDLKKFYKTNRRHAGSIQRLIDDRGFYCLNDRDIYNKTLNYTFFGDSHTANHRRIEFSFLPCQSGPYTDYDRSLKTEKNCETGPNQLQKIIDYLGTPEMIVYYNQEYFDTSAFGDKAIVKESVIKNTVFKPQDGPVWEFNQL